MQSINPTSSIKVTPDQLSSLGVNVDNINSQVDQEIATTQANTLSKIKIAEIIQNAPQGVEPREIISGLLERGYTLEGLDKEAEQEFRNPVSPTESETPQEEVSVNEEVDSQNGNQGGGVNKFLAGVAGNLEGGHQGLTNLAGGAIASVPSMIGNITGLFADIITPKKYEGLGDTFKEWGDKGEVKMQELLGVDPNAFTTSVGKFGGSLLGAGKITKGIDLVSKLSKLSQIKEAAPLVQGLSNLITQTPALQTSLNIGKKGLDSLQGFTSYKALSEGDLPTKTEAITSTVVGPLIDKVFKTVGKSEVVKQIEDKMGKLITKFSPSKLSKQEIDKEIGNSIKGMALVKAYNPELIVNGNEAVNNFLNASNKTRLLIGKELEKARGVGGVDFSGEINWLDKMKQAMTVPNFRKKLTDRELKEFNALNKHDTKEVVGALTKAKDNLESKLKNGKLSISQADDQIIGTNAKIGSLYNKASKSGARTGLIIDDALNSKMKEKLDATIGKVKGPEFRKLKSDYAAVRKVEDNLSKIYGQLLRKKDVSLTDYTDVFSLGNLGQAALTGDVSGAIKSGLMLAIRKKFTQMNDPNYVLEKSFNLLDKLDGKTPFKDLLKSGAGEVLKKKIPEGVGYITGSN